MEPESLSGIDMICGRRVFGDPDYIPTSEYRGTRVYFCTEYCLGAFLSDPDRFVEVHKNPESNCIECDLDY